MHELAGKLIKVECDTSSPTLLLEVKGANLLSDDNSNVIATPNEKSYASICGTPNVECRTPNVERIDG